MEDYWKFQGLGGGRVPKIFTEKCEPKMEFSEGRRGSNRKPSMGGGEYGYCLEQFTKES
jgi:hypothetical protein